ncbi:hypothetical protein P7C73_g5175, partial [Tremellales sp. Uapishka_1]
MSQVPILSSPFLNATIIDSLLASSSASATEKTQLLAAKIHLLTNASTPRDDPRELLQTRHELAVAYFYVEPKQLVNAESELTIVENEIKGFEKGSRKRGELEGDVMVQLKKLRIRNLELLVEVEETLGRSGRAERWRLLAAELEKDTR